MCGIVGFYKGSSNFNNVDVVKKMMNTIVHRGPDNEGYWINYNDSVTFGHRRLSIIDLSNNGAQPIISKSGRYVMVYNGETYNYSLIKKELLKTNDICFKGTSDTEVLLEAIDLYGFEKALNLIVGMFSIAVYDKQENSIYLARDRMGEKPLYYGFVNNSFVFASELNAFKVIPGFENPINQEVLPFYLRRGYIPTPYTIFQNIYKLKPGTLLILKCDVSMKIEVSEYWSVKSAVIKGMQNPFTGSKVEAIETLEKLLLDSVKGQMISDVELGAFLSGGIDSSLIVSIMQLLSNKPVKTFSIGFEDAEFNEAPYAKDIAKHLGTNHHELYVSSNDAMNVIPKLSNMYSEPFADSSQIPTYLVSEIARQHVTVSLSGDAGDELFCGYNSYKNFNLSWDKIQAIPLDVRKMIGKTLSNKVFEGLFSLEYFNKLFKRGLLLKNSDCIESFYGSCAALGKQDILKGADCITPLNDSTIWIDGISSKKKLMYLDQLVYLPDDILTKVDRASMGVSLETRIPLLDHRIIEFSWTLDDDLLYNNGISKWILRQILYKYVPKELIDRPKKGFSIPKHAWIRGPLREWAEDLLDYNNIKDEGLLDPIKVKSIFKGFINGNDNYSTVIWHTLMLEQWLRKNKYILNVSADHRYVG